MSGTAEDRELGGGRKIVNWGGGQYSCISRVYVINSLRNLWFLRSANMNNINNLRTLTIFHRPCISHCLGTSLLLQSFKSFKYCYFSPRICLDVGPIEALTMCCQVCVQENHSSANRLDLDGVYTHGKMYENMSVGNITRIH